MEFIHTEIDLESSPEAAWQTLVDFAAYPEWNPFLKRVEGRISPGARLKVEMELPAGHKRTFHPRIVRYTPGEEIRWLGRFFIPGLLDGEHAFMLERFRSDRVRFFQREIFRGALVPMIRRRQDEIFDAFTRMNEAFKARVESQNRARRGGQPDDVSRRNAS